MSKLLHSSSHFGLTDAIHYLTNMLEETITYNKNLEGLPSPDVMENILDEQIHVGIKAISKSHKEFNSVGALYLKAKMHDRAKCLIKEVYDK